MNVTLLSYTPDALNLLLRTKNTRLKFDQDPADWPEEQRQEHLSYMRDTIKSSWEFVDYVFEIEGVTRAFTHQLVRTRTGSYAQEAMRVIDAREHEIVMPEPLKNNEAGAAEWRIAEAEIRRAYGFLIDSGVAAQDARGILPTNITTSICAKFNLRTLHETAKLRLCTRTQGEYQEVFRLMRQRVFEVHPWVDKYGFLEVHCVSTGTCAFPRYGKAECPIYLPAMDNQVVRDEAKQRWETIRHEAAPVAKHGKAM